MHTYAEEEVVNGADLSKYSRDSFEFKAGEIKALRLKRAQEFYEFATTHSIPMEKGFKWSREMATERKMRCLA